MDKEREPADSAAVYLSPSFDDEPEVEAIEAVDDDELTDDNHPVHHD